MRIMRIIAGEYKSRKIKQPKAERTRSTKDRIREAVFNMIAGEVPGSVVMDLFAGSGAFGLEALSRGAKKAVFVEKDARSARVIKENIGLLKVQERTLIITKDAFKAIEDSEGDKFDLIFADPPYNSNMIKKVLIIINQCDIVNSSGFLVLEHHKNEDIPDSVGNVSIYKQRTYGKITISVFKKNA